MTAIRRCAVIAIVFFAVCAAHGQWLPPGQTSGAIYYPNGNVGVGTTNPRTLLHVGAGTDLPNYATTALYVTNNGSVGITARDSLNDVDLFVGTAGLGGGKYAGLFGTRTNHDLYLQANSANDLVVQALTGYVGIGVTNPLSRLHVGVGTDAPNNTSTVIYATNNGPTGITARDSLNHVDLLVGTAALGGGKFVGLFGTRTNHDLYLQANGNNDVIIEAVTGNVGIGTTGAPTQKLDVNGNINVSGNINAKWQDVAEWVPSKTQLAAGTVVVIDGTENNHVKPSDHAYDTTVAGVVSERPGVLLGDAGPSKSQVATSGRVRVRVDASHRAVKIGDLLVTSGEAGMAMVSEPIDLGGVKIHRPGTLIGKALEPLSGGRGEILVLLSLQ